MRQFLLGLSISAAFILGCVAAQTIPELTVPSAAAYSGPAWEYQCGPYPTFAVMEDKDIAEYTKFLNQHGARGWELITTEYKAYLCFKRPV